ncbi:PREDICTED: uncharacterized protein C6orf201 homolog [Elephantulus edwardii]|uniref:uncharacterized protein C6orf201 homolog n=1 Tax=Elephantulus edwardii TaxID=28737 RepID=UPI0003F087E6|nr:PREDICTED: uncharacterized protein C6orf201 homolog [Elephantulus edwardii]
MQNTFKMLSNLHKLLPSHLMDTLSSYKSEEDERKCEDAELSGLEKLLERYELLEDINLTPKPSSVFTWKRKASKNANSDWKKCHVWKKTTTEPLMSTVIVRWLKKNMQPTEDLQSAIQRLSVFGPIQSFSLCGRQSAIVVFEDMTSACKAVNAFQSRSPGTMFQCSWKHRFLSKDIRLLRKS